MTQPRPHRTAQLDRNTSETRISVRIDLDQPAPPKVVTGIGFLDHMLTSFGKHSGIGLMLTCAGDLEIDDHHTAEDCALALGSAIDQALGDRRGIRRFAHALVPMDEALARVAIDQSGRAHAAVDCGFTRPTIGNLATENITHFFASLAANARMTLHVDVLRGTNDHHRAEAAFKALAVAMRESVAIIGIEIPSTKGSL